MTASPDLRPRATTQAEPARIVLVTDGTHGLGRALALGFAEQGWDVAVHHAGAPDAAEPLLVQIRALGRRAVALRADLGIEREAEQLVPACTAALGRPVCAINHASLTAQDSVHNAGYDTLLKLTAVNVAAPVVLARALYDATPETAREHERERAVVINMLDQKLDHPNPDRLSYSLSKAALQTATVALARSLAPKVRVVGLVPGDAPPEAGYASFAEDVVAAARYLAGANGVTGATLVVDGGRHLQPLARDATVSAR
ncbi:SDR family NAD(P)-dependent oxidoreductase [Trinickia fusca]|uniref:SDR family NAD(P)-dependent oxidoreductase n=1 Tax=Trinickia fusca TaxID=2419777 RepID=A0A494XFF2_9BURK|nr:SDR family NAD(P)-dependent oxidoreductase [Trinickia fusca]RKP49370.1 SDR family NAD(P)-dependent oxidoreductase [Trinickia fusca]